MWRKKEVGKCNACLDEKYHAFDRKIYIYKGASRYCNINTKICILCYNTFLKFYYYETLYGKNPVFDARCNAILTQTDHEFWPVGVEGGTYAFIAREFNERKNTVEPALKSKEKLTQTIAVIKELNHRDSNSYFSLVPLDVINFIIQKLY